MKMFKFSNLLQIRHCSSISETRIGRQIHRLTTSKLLCGRDRLIQSADHGSQPTDNGTGLTNETESETSESETERTGCLSQKLFTQNRLVHGAANGTFYLLALLTRSFEKLVKIVDIEMQGIGAQKIIMPSLASKQLWSQSKRWERMGSELFRLTDRTGAEHCLAPTHEEAMTSLVAMESPVSLRKLPIKLYQIGRKFRDEGRPKHALLRCREFEMKDLYTFDVDELHAELTYKEVSEAYVRIFNQLQLPFITVQASSGSMGGNRSEEIHLLSSVGEDRIMQCIKCGKAINAELYKDELQAKHQHCKGSETPCVFQQESGIEIAHLFLLGTLYTETFKAHFIDSDQVKRPLYMACFGIGMTRLLSAAVEVLSAKDGIRWPTLLAPYQICIVPQKEGFKSEVTDSIAEQLYDQLSSLANLKNEVLLDDRTHLSIGHRVNWARSMGFPHIIVIGKQALEAEPILEHIDVYNDVTSFVSAKSLTNCLSNLDNIIL